MAPAEHLDAVQQALTGGRGVDVVVDPIGGAADYHRWPVTDDAEGVRHALRQVDEVAGA